MRRRHFATKLITKVARNRYDMGLMADALLWRRLVLPMVMTSAAFLAAQCRLAADGFGDKNGRDITPAQRCCQSAGCQAISANKPVKPPGHQR